MLCFTSLGLLACGDDATDTDTDGSTTEATDTNEPDICAPFDVPTSGGDETTEGEDPAPDDAHLLQCAGVGNGTFRANICLTAACAAPPSIPEQSIDPIVFPDGEPYGLLR